MDQWSVIHKLRHLHQTSTEKSSVLLFSRNDDVDDDDDDDDDSDTFSEILIKELNVLA